MVVEIIAFSRIYGVSRLYRDVEFMLKRELCLFWAFCWGFLVPVFLSFIWIYFAFFTDPLAYKNQKFPESYLCKLRNIFDRELALAVLYVCFRLLLVFLFFLIFCHFSISKLKLEIFSFYLLEYFPFPFPSWNIFPIGIYIFLFLIGIFSFF